MMQTAQDRYSFLGEIFVQQQMAIGWLYKLD